MKAAPRTRRRPSNDYSDKFLADYGRKLTRDDVRLVQAFRGLPAAKRTALLENASLAVVSQAQEPHAGARTKPPQPVLIFRNTAPSARRPKAIDRAMDKYSRLHGMDTRIAAKVEALIDDLLIDCTRAGVR